MTIPKSVAGILYVTKKHTPAHIKEIAIYDSISLQKALQSREKPYL